MGPCCFPRACGPEAGEPEKPPWAAALSMPQFPSYPFSPTLLFPPPGTRGSSPGPSGIQVGTGARWSGAEAASSESSGKEAMAGSGEVGRGRAGSGPRPGRAERTRARAGPRDPPSCPRAERRPKLPPFLATRGPFRPQPLT